MKRIAHAIWKLILEIPIFGPIALIFCAWVNDGDDEVLWRFPSAFVVFKKIWAFLTMSMAVSYVFLNYFVKSPDSGATLKRVIDVGLLTFPSLLGVGLAIFLLLFALDGSKIDALNISEKKVGALCDSRSIKSLLVAELAHPVILLAINVFLLIIASVFFEFIYGNIIFWVGCFFVFFYVYSMCLIFNMLMSVFLLARRM